VLWIYVLFRIFEPQAPLSFCERGYTLRDLGAGAVAIDLEFFADERAKQPLYIRVLKPVADPASEASGS
jgi:hypothetical protein